MSDDILNINVNLKKRTNVQASNIEAMIESLKAINTAVNDNASNSVNAYQITVDACQSVEKSRSTVEDSIQVMDEINKSSMKIEGFISIINGIAFQTNLLALNAAVEAARAGESGRGFAVVATEVRTLSNKSSEAASHIQKLIEDNLAVIKKGVAIANKTYGGFQEISQSFSDINIAVNEITTSCKKQTVTINEVNDVVIHIEENTEKNASLAQEVSDKSSNMCSQINSLIVLLKYFILKNAEDASAEQ